MTPPLASKQDGRPVLAKALEAYRQEKGWSQKEMGEHFGVQQSTLNNWMTGRNTPTLETWADLEDHEGLPRGYFFIQAGLVAIPQTLEHMIRIDPRFDERAVETMLAMTETMAKGAERRREQQPADEP